MAAEEREGEGGREGRTTDHSEHSVIIVSFLSFISFCRKNVLPSVHFLALKRAEHHFSLLPSSVVSASSICAFSSTVVAWVLALRKENMRWKEGGWWKWEGTNTSR